MLIIPKPPKLHYYLAGLAVFILTLGVVGFYLYQKQNIPTTQTNLTQPSQNSLTSNPEPSKTSIEANNKPKEENLVSKTLSVPSTKIPTSNFEADPNVNTVVFKECNVSLKLNASKDLIVFKNKKFDTTASTALLIMGTNKDNKLFTEGIACSKSENSSNTYTRTSKYPKWLEEYKDKLDLKQENTGELSLHFKIDDNYFTITPNLNLNLISSVLFRTDNQSSSNSLKIIDLSETKFQNLLEQKKYIAPVKKIKDINLIGCDYSIFHFVYDDCIVADENYEPLFSLDASSHMIQKGLKTDKSRYLIYYFGDVCVSNASVSEYNFVTGKLDTVDTGGVLRFSGCADLTTNEMQIDADCFNSSKRGTDSKKCFKNPDEYEKYLKEYNDEQAQNKTSDAKLAKYLE